MERLAQPNSRSTQTTSTRPIDPKAMVMNILFLALKNWYWFILSLVISLGFSIWKILRTPKTYSYTTSILIKSNQALSVMEEELQKVGMFETAPNTTNEILSLKTSVLAMDIVNRLNLDVNYYREGRFQDRVVYGLDLPVQVEFLDLNDNASASMELHLEAGQKVRLSKLVRNGNPHEGIYPLNLGDTIQTAIGSITVHPSAFYRDTWTDQLKVQRTPLRTTANIVSSRITAKLRDQNGTVIDIHYRDVSTDRAEDILNTLVAVYNENWVKERNRMSVSTNAFIKERLQVIEQELGMVDQNISEYKSSHLFTDVQSAGSAAMGQAQSAEQKNWEIDNQIYITRYIRDHLTNPQNEDQLLPANSGLGNTNLETQIKDYNDVLLRRNKYLANSSANNPLVKQLDQNLSEMKQSIVSTLDNDLNILRVSQQSTQASHSKATARVAANPQQHQHLLSIERQQKVKESLYLFLLQKREENELSQAFTAYNTKLVEPPHPSGAPAQPIDSQILMMGFIIGLIIPIAIIALCEFLNTTVRGKNDLKQLTIPYIGEIPQVAGEKGKKKKKKDEKSLSTVVVKEKSRDYINEAFRVVRSNLEFALGYESNHHVIMLTGLDIGAGKTFLCLNLATVLGIKNKKVILVDLDLRKGSLSESLQLKGAGVSNFLIGQEAQYTSLIQSLENVDVLPCGTLPPNPTELLYTKRFKQLMEELQAQYDYVLLDCPPVEIIADAAIINPYVDMTLFVVRSHLTDRGCLHDLEQWYQDKKYKNLTLILNGTTHELGKYGYNRYGYHRYGYQSYGYANS